MRKLIQFITRRRTRELVGQHKRASQKAAEYLAELTARTREVHRWDRAGHNYKV
jgi:hypothetical protein